MFVELEDFKNGWFQVSVGLNKDDITLLIEQLKMLQEDPEQHFHISSDYKGSGGVGDIEIYVKDDNASNMNFLGLAISPSR